MIVVGVVSRDVLLVVWPVILRLWPIDNQVDQGVVEPALRTAISVLVWMD